MQTEVIYHTDFEQMMRCVPLYLLKINQENVKANGIHVNDFVV